MTSFTNHSNYPSDAQFAQMGKQMYAFVLSLPIEHQRPLSQVPREPNCVQSSCFVNYTSIFNRRFFSYALGTAGFISLFASCLASWLIPAICSTGIISVACLLKRKVTVLNSSDLPVSAGKTQKVKESNLLSVSASIASSESPLLEVHSTPQEEVLSIPNTGSEQLPPSKTSTAPLPLPTSLEEMEELLKSNSQTYTTNLLVRELKSTYKRMLEICEVKNPSSKPKILRTWKEYFTKKVEEFEQRFPLSQQTESSDAKVIFEITRNLHSLTENMKWTQSLLNILSERRDLDNEAKTHCKDKATTIVKHIQKLEAEELESYKDQFQNKEFQFFATGSVPQSMSTGVGSSNVTNVVEPPPPPPPPLRTTACSQESEDCKKTQPLDLFEAMAGTMQVRRSCIADSSPDATPVPSDDEGDWD